MGCQRSGRVFIPPSFILDRSMREAWLSSCLFALSGVVTPALGRRCLPVEALDYAGKLLQSNLNYRDGGVWGLGVFRTCVSACFNFHRLQSGSGCAVGPRHSAHVRVLWHHAVRALLARHGGFDKAQPGFLPLCGMLLQPLCSRAECHPFASPGR